MMIPAYNKKGCAAFHSRQESITDASPTSFPEENTTMPHSGFEPEPTQFQAEGHAGWAAMLGYSQTKGLLVVLWLHMLGAPAAWGPRIIDTADTVVVKPLIPGQSKVFEVSSMLVAGWSIIDNWRISYKIELENYDRRSYNHVIALLISYEVHFLTLVTAENRAPPKGLELHPAFREVILFAN
ncbi:hypothetical protein TNCV_2925241 [Trichonephila clavipes]|nr:hypothetical protein TNCV_2925241 [Trichonephila clavipes]